MASSNSRTNLNLPNVPIGIDDPVIYESILNIHTAIEALLTAFGDVDTGSSATLDGLQAYVLARTNVLFITADYSILQTNGTILIDSSLQAVVASLPTAVTIRGTRFEIKHSEVGAANSAKVATLGTELINGSLDDFILYPAESITLQSNGANWEIL